MYLAQSFDPTRPDGTLRLQVTNAAYGAVFLFLAFFTAPRVGGWPHVRKAWVLVRIAFWFQLVSATSFMILSGGGLLFVINHTAGYVTAGVELAVLGGLVWAWRRGRLSGRAFRVIFILGVFANSILNVGLCAWMWRPEPAAVCDAGVGEFVERLTPQKWHEEFSHPHTLYIIPERHAVAVAFKMSGDLTIYPWDVETSNRAALFDIRDPDAGVPMTEIPRTGGDMPLFFDWDAEGQLLIMANMGLGDGSVDFIDLSAWPDGPAPIVRTEDIDFAPARPFYYPIFNRLVILSLYGDVFVFDYETFEQKRHYRLHPDGSDLLTTGCRRVPDSHEVVASVMGFDLLRTDWQTGDIRGVDVGWSLGDMTIAPYTFRSYSADFAFRAINVVELATMQREARVDVDYAPRGFSVDGKRDLLAVGDWFGGWVHLYRASTMEELAPPIRLSPYLRAMEFETERGDLYVTGKCGLYRVKVGKYLERHAGLPDAAPPPT